MPQYVVWRSLSESGHIERRNAIHRLTIDPQDFAAGHENRGVWTHAYEALGQVGRRIDDVLAIVEYQQKMSRANIASDGLRGHLAAELQPERAGHRGQHEIGIGQRRQVDKPTTVVESGDQAARGLDRKRCFPDASWACQRHDPISGDKVLQMSYGRRATDQAAGEHGKVVRRGFADQGGIDASGRRARVPGRPTPQQTIASTGGRFQHGSIRPKRFADRGYMNLECIFADHGAWPDAAHNVFLGDQFIGRPNQKLDDFERARADGHRGTTHQ